MKKLLTEVIAFCDSVISYVKEDSVYKLRAINVRKQCIEMINDLNYFNETNKQSGLVRMERAIHEDFKGVFLDEQPKNAGEAHDQTGMYNETFSNE